MSATHKNVLLVILLAGFFVMNVHGRYSAKTLVKTIFQALDFQKPTDHGDHVDENEQPQSTSRSDQAAELDRRLAQRLDDIDRSSIELRARRIRDEILPTIDALESELRRNSDCYRQAEYMQRVAVLHRVRNRWLDRLDLIETDLIERPKP